MKQKGKIEDNDKHPTLIHCGPPRWAEAQDEGRIARLGRSVKKAARASINTIMPDHRTQISPSPQRLGDELGDDGGIVLVAAFAGGGGDGWSCALLSMLLVSVVAVVLLVVLLLPSVIRLVLRLV